MRIAITTYICLLLAASTAFGQVSFVATADAKEIVENSTVGVTFKLSNAQGTSFTPPAVKGLKLVGGPSTSTSMSIVNGRSTSSTAYTYSYLATMAGTYTIGPATIKVQGKTLKTSPLQIRVVKGKAATNTSDKKTFVRVEITDTTAAVGQQIRLDYMLYTQQNVNNYGLLNEPEYDGFYSFTTTSPKSKVQRTIIDGEEYYVKGMKSIVLFPQRTGSFDIDEVVVELGIPIPGQRSRNFFAPAPTRKLRVSTQKRTIVVSDLPEPRPPSFSGAVGKYRMTASIEDRRITTDDAILLNMEIRGNGDGKTISAPIQPVQKDLEYYDPNVLQDENLDQVGYVDNYKKIEYLIVPKKPGTYTIKPEFTYYDPDSNRYETLTAGPFSIRVAKGSNKVIADDRDISVRGQMMPAKSNAITISRSNLRYGGGVLYGGLGLCFLGLLGILYKKRQLDIEAGIDPAERRRRQALSVATQQLSKAKEYLDAGDGRAFFSEVSTAMNGFLGDKYQIPNADLDKAKIKQHLEERSVNQQYVNRYLEILKKCEMAIFAGQTQQGMADVYEQSLSLIQDLAVS